MVSAELGVSRDHPLVSPYIQTNINPVTKVFNGVPASCFPASTGLGSSFDVDLARKVGEAIGDEARAKSEISFY
jgi:hypothetical protein